MNDSSKEVPSHNKSFEKLLIELRTMASFIQKTVEVAAYSPKWDVLVPCSEKQINLENKERLAFIQEAQEAQVIHSGSKNMAKMDAVQQAATLFNSALGWRPRLKRSMTDAEQQLELKGQKSAPSVAWELSSADQAVLFKSWDEWVQEEDLAPEVVQARKEMVVIMKDVLAHKVDTLSFHRKFFHKKSVETLPSRLPLGTTVLKVPLNLGGSSSMNLPISLKKLVLSSGSDTDPAIYPRTLGSWASPDRRFSISSPLQALQELAATACRLIEVSLSSELPALKSLSLPRNRLKSLDTSPAWRALIRVQLADNQLEKFVIQSTWQALQYLNLAENELDSIDIPELPMLETLYLSNNHLSSFVTLSRLPALKQLFLFDNQLGHFSVPELPMLENLGLWQNRLTRFPEQLLLKLPALKILTLVSNRLTSFHIPLASSALTDLVLSHNQLAEFSIAPGSKALQSLKYLNLSHNRLTRVPDEIFSLPVTAVVDINNNPLSEEALQALKQRVAAPGYQGPKIIFECSVATTCA